jgi:Mlc titration factor MtfA (ptsG expression regulator)
MGWHHSGEAWQQGPVILAWPGVLASGGWEGYNLVIHELAHKLDMLNGDANGMPPCTAACASRTGPSAMQAAYDHLNHYLDHHNPDHAPSTRMRPKTRRSSLRSPANIFSAPRICWWTVTRRSTGN